MSTICPRTCHCVCRVYWIILSCLLMSWQLTWNDTTSSSPKSTFHYYYYHHLHAVSLQDVGDHGYVSFVDHTKVSQKFFFVFQALIKSSKMTYKKPFIRQNKIHYIVFPVAIVQVKSQFQAYIIWLVWRQKKSLRPFHPYFWTSVLLGNYPWLRKGGNLIVQGLEFREMEPALPTSQILQVCLWSHWQCMLGNCHAHLRLTNAG